MAVAINDDDQDAEYDVAGGGGFGGESGTIESGNLVMINVTGSSPWTVTFNNDPNLSVDLQKPDDGAQLYEDNGVLRVKHFPS